MEENKSVVSASLMYGIYLGLALIAYSLLMFVLDIDHESKLTWFSYLIMAGGLFWAMVSVRDNYFNGFVSYGKAFGIGFWVVLFAAVITSLFTYIYFHYLDPGMIDEILLKAEEAMLEGNPNISDEQLEQTLAMTEKFTSPLMISVWAFIANVIFGTILSLIIAIFAKREDGAAAA
jgi:hypothetical protein